MSHLNKALSKAGWKSNFSSRLFSLQEKGEWIMSFGEVIVFRGE
ncbi:hypothetical protein [Bacillus tianshenii]|nr:hypothetical protein [Bacillus tianshenii]